MELQGRTSELAKLGLSIIAVSPDPVETLAKFASEKRVTFPLLSDPGSRVIKRYGLLNETLKPGSLAFGAPWPGTFMIDAQLRVTARYLEDRIQERSTAASIIARQGGAMQGPKVTLANSQLSIDASISDDVVAPGSRITLVLDVTLARGIHVYAPGASYRVVDVVLDRHPYVLGHDLAFPPSEIYHFVPLNERVPVYKDRFKLVRDITIAGTTEAVAALSRVDRITIGGRFSYQACDDKVCYPPTSIPFSFPVRVKRLDAK